MKENKLKILVSYNKPSTLIKNDLFIPIHVGRDLKYKESNYCELNSDEYNWLLENMIGDNTDNNISYKNKEYYELTAIYWAWKNYEKIGNPDYIGIMHSRRLLNISIETKNYEIFDFNEKISNSIGFNKNNIDNILTNYDIILSEICDVHPWGLPDQIMNNYNFYCRNHIKNDIDKIINIINADYQNYKIDTCKYLNDTKSLLFNIFIMKKEIFLEYCEWLFAILFKYESMIDNIDISQNGNMLYISEMLLNIFIYNYIRVNKSNRIMYNNIVSILQKIDKIDYNKLILGNKSLLKSEKQKTKNVAEQIYIVYSTDDNYSQHCCVSMASLLLNTDENSYCNFIILDGGISKRNKDKILYLKNIKACEITFYDMSKFNFSNYKSREYISEATYYRLLLPKLLPNNINKMIYLDCDIIVETNIKKIWNIDIEDYSVLAADDECGVSQCRRLALPIKNRYFNAGVLVLNIDKFRQLDFYNECIESYKKNENIIALEDQDILNIVLNGKCKYIDLNWNTNSRIYLGNNLKGYDTPYFENSYSKKEEDNAKYNPYIIHYTDSIKPWDIYCNHPLKKEYFEYLKFTTFRLFKIKYIFNKYVFFYKKTKNFIKIRIFYINLNIKINNN